MVVAPVGLELPGIAPVAEADLEDLPEPGAVSAVVDGDSGFDAFREIAAHPVAGADQKLAVERIVGSGGEVEDAGVLEEAPDDRTHTDVFGPARNAGCKAAQPPHDQLDRDPCL